MNVKEMKSTNNGKEIDMELQNIYTQSMNIHNRRVMERDAAWEITVAKLLTLGYDLEELREARKEYTKARDSKDTYVIGYGKVTNDVKPGRVFITEEGKFNRMVPEGEEVKPVNKWEQTKFLPKRTITRMNMQEYREMKELEDKKKALAKEMKKV